MCIESNHYKTVWRILLAGKWFFVGWPNSDEDVHIVKRMNCDTRRTNTEREGDDWAVQGGQAYVLLLLETAKILALQRGQNERFLDGGVRWHSMGFGALQQTSLSFSFGIWVGNWTKHLLVSRCSSFGIKAKGKGVYRNERGISGRNLHKRGQQENLER